MGVLNLRGRIPDNVLYAQAALLVHEEKMEAARSILSNSSDCFAGFGGVPGASRSTLTDLWAVTAYAMEERRLGRNLTALEQRHLRRKLNGLGPDGSEKNGRWSPPNLGVWFGQF